MSHLRAARGNFSSLPAPHQLLGYLAEQLGGIFLSHPVSNLQPPSGFRLITLPEEEKIIQPEIFFKLHDMSLTFVTLSNLMNEPCSYT